MNRSRTTAGARIEWMLFVTLGFFWGSSYLSIKIGVDAGLQPFTLVALRLLVGFLLLAVVAAVARERLPREPRTYGHLAAIAVLSVALPFCLISWAEQSVDSTLAAVINGAIPLFVIVIAAGAARRADDAAQERWVWSSGSWASRCSSGSTRQCSRVPASCPWRRSWVRPSRTPRAASMPDGSWVACDRWSWPWARWASRC